MAKSSVDKSTKSTDEGVVPITKSLPPSSWIKTAITTIIALIAAVLIAAFVRDPDQLRPYLPSDVPIQDASSSTSPVAEFITKLQTAVAESAAHSNAVADEPSPVIEPIVESRLAPSLSIESNPNPIQASEPVSSKPIEVIPSKPDTIEAKAKPSSLAIIDWMIQGGASFPHLQLVEYGTEYRGLHATADLGEDEVLIDIPEKFIITFATARDSDIGQRLIKALPEYNDMDMSHYLIAAFLAVEYDRGTASWWWPYLETLPLQFKNMPPNFTPEEKKLMKESRMDSLLDDHFERDYEEICEAIPDFCQDHTLERYIWGRLILRTRAFSLEKDGIDQTALQPFADMINHDFDHVASWRYDQDRHTGQIYTRSPVKAGDTITISYGGKANRVLLSTYGFAIKDNPNHETPLYLQLPDGEISSGMLARRVAKHGNPNTEFYRILHTITLSTSDEDFKKVMKLCRISVATGDELDQYGDFSEPVNLRNEAAALRYLQESIDESLYKYKTTVEEDGELLRDPSLTTNQRNIIITRQSDKLTLMKMYELIEDLMDIVPESVDLATFNRRRYHQKFADHKTYLRSLFELRRSKRQAL